MLEGVGGCGRGRYFWELWFEWFYGLRMSFGGDGLGGYSRVEVLGREYVDVFRV